MPYNVVNAIMEVYACFRGNRIYQPKRVVGVRVMSVATLRVVTSELRGLLGQAEEAEEQKKPNDYQTHRKAGTQGAVCLACTRHPAKDYVVLLCSCYG